MHVLYCIAFWDELVGTPNESNDQGNIDVAIL